MGVAVGNMGVAVGKGVLIAAGVSDAVGVAVGAGAKDAQDERINVKRKRTRTDGGNLFRMGCILPLVAKIYKFFGWKLRVKMIILVVLFMRRSVIKKPPAESFPAGGFSK